jgi:LmbE family N-acetylglucosaminyl deacetylase
MPYRRILAVGAHTDDVELGAGGFLARAKREGAAIKVVALSRAESSLPEGAPVDALEREFRSSMEVLGADEVHVGGYPVRRLQEHRQDVLDELIRIRKGFQPDLVLTMHSQDSHQDHAVVHAESVRAFRGVSLLGYELPWNQRETRQEMFVELTEDDLAQKMRMLACYGTQQQLSRSYMDPEVTRAMALTRGLQSRLPLAEMFEVVTMIWRA